MRTIFDIALRGPEESLSEGSPPSMTSLIVKEQEFRKKPQTIDGFPSQVVISRWTFQDIRRPVELVADPKSLDDSHVITFALKPTNATITYQGREFFHGAVPSRNLLMTGPLQAIRTIQRAPFDGIRMYLPQSLLANCFEEAHGRPASSMLTLLDPSMTTDPMIARLMLLIYEWDLGGPPFVPSFLDGIGLAVAARLVQLDRLTMSNAAPSKEALAGFRLRRVVDYVTHNLHRPIQLAELASVAGLSRMRFACQFRAATGYSPHDYILRQKIGRAQDMLLTSREPIINVALGLGFRSQAHFSTVFKRYVGGSPARWRSELPKPRVDGYRSSSW